MPKTVSGLKIIKFLTRKGFEIYSRKGSHVKMVSLSRNTKTIIPVHKEVSKPTLHSIFRQAKLNKEEIQELIG